MKLMRALLAVIATGLLFACNGDDDQATPNETYDPPTWVEYVATPASGTVQEQIDRFVAANNLDTTITSSGLIYVIQEPGEAARPSASSTVLAFYRGSIVDNRVFDQRSSTPTAFNLQSVIDGWTEGVPLIGREGQITLIIRPALAYGNVGIPSQNISGSMPLVFQIRLADWQ